jgi:hypothetical protein
MYTYSYFWTLMFFNTCLASSNELLHKKYEDLLVKAASNSMNSPITRLNEL